MRNKQKYEFSGINQKICLNSFKTPLYAYLQLNTNCNFKCKFCSREKMANRSIDYTDFKYVINILSKVGIKDIYITGGEPLLHPKIDDMIEYALTKKMSISILTNGFYIDKHVELLKKVACLSVSLHGEKETHNRIVGVKCYDKIINNINLLLGKVNLTINYTAFNENINEKDIMAVYNFCDHNKIKMNISRYNDLGCGKVNQCDLDLNVFMKTIYELVEKEYDISVNNCIAPCVVSSKYLHLCHGCGAGSIFCAIDYDLNVKICSSASQVMGNLKKQSLNKIWNGKILKTFRGLKWLPIYCKSCINLARCRGGCRIELGNHLLKLNDKNVHELNENTWKRIKDKKFEVLIGKVRKEANSFISLSTPSRLFSKDVLNVLQKIQCNGIISDLEQYKDLILSLYRDKVIKEKQ